MIVIRVDNVNDAYQTGLECVVGGGTREESRNGPVIVAQEPVVTEYEKPTQRVLFSESRDANPYFHLMESLWMLSGRCDVEFPARYAKQMREYAETDGNIHGAYGHRWRRAFGYDQIREIVTKLKKNHADRQAVLQMWDARQRTVSVAVSRSASARGFLDADAGSDDLRGAWKDRPCNTHVYFRVRRVPTTRGGDLTYDDHLDMTVCCRSNDAIWGAYGANAVHFSVLMEYVAAMVGARVGVMYQLSNNLHVYDNALLKRCYPVADTRDLYAKDSIKPATLVGNPSTFIDECEWFVATVQDAVWNGAVGYGAWSARNPFLSHVAWYAAVSHEFYRRGDIDAARRWAGKMEADDWRLACLEWLNRRNKGEK